jgi:uncharacterized protein (TIGR03084 family)
MDELIDDLVAEQRYLDAAVCDVPAARWERASPAEGWLMRDCIAHLADLDDVAAHILTTNEMPPPHGYEAQGVLAGRQVWARSLTIAELLDWWRDASARLEAALRPTDPRRRLPWAGLEMGARSFATARLMECWSHGLDALDAAGIEAVDSDRLRHVAHLGYASRPYAYTTRGLEPNDEPLRVEVVAPSGATWTWGDEEAANRIEGTAGEFCRVVTQRIHYLDTSLRWEGEPAREFLEIAQAFAGPPGMGRAPTGQA